MEEFIKKLQFFTLHQKYHAHPEPENYDPAAITLLQHLYWQED
jgi:hypothetical protein